MDNVWWCFYFLQILCDVWRIGEYYLGLLFYSVEFMDRLGVFLVYCEFKCQNFYDVYEVEWVYYLEMEKLFLEFFFDVIDVFVYNYDVFDKDYQGDCIEN